MIKKLLFTIIIFLLSLIHCEATEISFTADFSNKFYKLESCKFKFIPLKDEDYRKLSKTERKSYNNLKKAHKFYTKALEYNVENKKYEKYHLKTLKYNPYHWASYNNLCVYYFKNRNYELCVQNGNIFLSAIKSNHNPTYYQTMHKVMVSYFWLNAYEKAYDMAMRYIESKDNDLDKEPAYFIIANSLLYKDGDKIKNYNEALTYTNKYINSEKLDSKINAHEVRYEIYIYKKRNDLAEKEAKSLIELHKIGRNYIKLANCVKNRNDKIKYLKEANDWGLTDDEFKYCFFEIAKLEQSKIDDVVKKLGLYVKKPNWHDVWDSTQYGSDDYWYKRIDKFFESTNKCIKDYRGQNLVACFNQVNEEQERLTRELEEYIFRQQQLAYQQELIRQQQLQNYYQSQNAYYARQNYYESTRPKTYTVTPIGNTYHVNQW